MKNFYYTKLFLGLFLVLWIPYLLKLKSPYFEIYPSLVMPVGANVFYSKGNTIEFETFEIIGSKDNLDKIIFLEELYPGIPPHYFLQFIKTGFGTKSLNDSFFVWGKIPMKRFNRFSKAERKNAVFFLKNRLINAGYSPDFLEIKKLRILFDISTKDIISKTIVDEELIELN